MPPLSAEQVTAALANMAQVSAQAAIDAQTVDFGDAPQPELHILQWWKSLHIPAAQMKAMNACRMGTQANLAIYFDNEEKPTPEAMLLCLCKARNQGTPGHTTAAGVVVAAVASTDAGTTDWTQSKYAENMINATPNTAVWWVHVVRTVLQRTKVSAVQLEKQQRYANRFPDLAPVIPVNERNTFYNRIEHEIPALVLVHGKFLRPHTRLIDILEQIAKQQKPIPCYKPSEMWAETDDIVTSHNQVGKATATDSEVFAVGYDVVRKPILVTDWDGWRCRMVCFALGLAAAGMGTIKDAETRMLRYFGMLQHRFKDKYSIPDIMEVDMLIRQEILDDQNDERGKNTSSTRWCELLEEKTEKTGGASRVMMYMSTVQCNRYTGMKRQAQGGAVPATPLQRARLEDPPAVQTTTPEKSLYNKLKRDRTKENKRLKALGLLPPPAPPPGIPPPGIPPPNHAQLALAIQNAPGLKGGGKGRGKGAKGGAQKGGNQLPPVNNQHRYPDGEHALIMEYLNKPGNEGVCRQHNSSKGCSYGAACKFTNTCLGCGAADHGLQSCPRNTH